jgi:LacI family transcriptional regulator
MLLIDGPVRTGSDPLPVDLLLMENSAGIYSFVMQLAEKGRKSVGFIGNMRHCRSFFERGSTCISTAAVYGFLPAEQFSILNFPPGPDPTKSATYADYTDDLYDLLQKLPALPDAFVCANDYIAINLISSLRRMNLSCPEDILVMGFDDSPESRFHSPSLSTVHVHTQALGDLAAELLLSRIAEPDREPRTVYSYTDLILRESTRLD